MCGRYTVPDHPEWSERVEGQQLGLPGLFPEVLAFTPDVERGAEPEAPGHRREPERPARGAPVPLGLAQPAD